MTSSSLAVASYASIVTGRAASRLRGEWTVWYLGNDYARLLELRTALPPETRFAPVAERVNAAAHALLPLVLDLDAVLAGPGFERAAWDASDLADRSRYNSPFYLELCRAAAVLGDGDPEEHRLAIVDDDAFALALFDAARASGRPVRWLGPARAPLRARNAVANAAGAGRRALGDLRAAIRRLRVLRRARTGRPLDGEALRNVDTWITVWATDRTFAPGAPLEREERVGRLPALLRGANVKLGYLVMPLWPERFAEIAIAALRCAEPVVLVEDGLRLRDLCAAILGALRGLPGVRRRLLWKGLDLSALLQRALTRERLTGRPVKARLVAALPRLLATHGASPRTIVTTYENHSWEKVLIGGVRNHLPATQILGYNHASCPPLYISLNPTHGDVAANNIPDRVLTMGALGAEALASRGFPPERLTVVGGLRFEDFFERARSLPPPPAAWPRTALCCVAVDLDEGVELVHKSAQAVAGVAELALLVNFHPMSSAQFRAQLKTMLRERATPGFERIRFDDRPVRDLLAEVHAVLYIDSNAALEAAAAGRQIIYVVRETGLEYDKMPPGLSRHCRTPEEIRRALLAGGPAADARALFEHFIAPVAEEQLVAIARGAPTVGPRRPTAVVANAYSAPT